MRANPEARVLVDGAERPYVAHEAEGEERARLWRRAVEAYSGYEDYQARAGGRRIPVVVLTPAGETAQA